MKAFRKVISVLLSLVLAIGILPIALVSQAEGLDYTVDETVATLINKYNSRIKAYDSEMDANIEAYRKSDATVKIVDKDGNPVKNATVTVNQTSHDFDFGCNALMLGQYDTKEKNEKYEQLLKDTFNTLTTTMCFDIYSDGDNDYDFDYNEFRRPSPKVIRDFAKANNMNFKVQPLLADGWNPSWATTTNVTALRQIYKNWFQAVYDEFGDDLDIVDVVNESTSLWKSRTPSFPFNNDVLGNVKWAYQTAQEIWGDSKTKLEINDAYPYLANYKSTRVESLASENLIDSIGIQYHIFSGANMINHVNNSYYNIETTYSNLKSMSEVGLPMYISEITMPTNLDGYTTEQAYAIQAEVVKRLYKMWFSIPNMNGIIYWNLADGEQWGSEGDALGCLVDSELNPKPAYYVIQNYINNEWRTNLTLTTDENGEVSFRGFHGDYSVTAKTDDGYAAGKFSVLKDGSNTLTLSLSDSFDDTNVINADSVGDLSSWTIGSYDENGVKTDNSDSACTAKYISVNGNCDYTVNAKDCTVKVCEYDLSGNFIKTANYSSGNSFTTSENCGYITLSLSGDAGSNIIAKIEAGTLTVSLKKDGEWVTPEPKPAAGEYLTAEQISSPFFWQMGHYSTTGAQAKAVNRIRVRKLIEVSTNSIYNFNVNLTDCDYKYIIREYDSSGTYINNAGVFAPGADYTPSESTAYIGLSMYIPDSSAKTVSLKKVVSNGTLALSATVNTSSEPDPGTGTDPEPDPEPEEHPDPDPSAESYNLLDNGGSWVKGQYLSSVYSTSSRAGWLDDGSLGGSNSGGFLDPNSSYRIALNKKIDVIPGKTYSVDVGSSVETIKFVIRGYDSSGAFTTFTPATIIKGDLTIPNDVVKIGIGLYDTRMKNGPTGATLLGMISDGTLTPSITDPYAVNVMMSYGASIRLNNENGIRFYTNVDKQRIAELQANGATVELGTIIAPKDLISGEFTHEDENIDVKYTAVNSDGSFKYYEDSSGWSGVVGSIVRIKDTNISRDFVGRGYVKVTDGENTYISYADYYDSNTTNNTRSMKYVASALRNDTSNYERLNEALKKLVDGWAGVEVSKDTDTTLTYTAVESKNEIVVNNALLHNVSALTKDENGEGYLVSRLPDTVSSALTETGQKVNHFATGVEIRFVINSGSAIVTLSKSKLTNADPETVSCYVYYGNTLQNEYTVTADKTNIVIDKPETADYIGGYSSQVIRVVFFYRSIKIHNITGDIRVPESTEVPAQTALFYGSSITNGASAAKTSDTFAYRLAESLEMDYYNLGMSGSCMCEQEVADYIASLEGLSFISLEMGANMHSYSNSDFKAKVKAFIKTVATAHSDIPVFCVDQIYNYDDKAGGGSDKKTTQMRVAVKEAVSELGLSNTVYVNGLTLMNSADGLSSDSVHPNQTGIDEVYSNYLPIIKNYIP